MKIYINNKQISKIDIEKPFFIGSEFADKIELYVQNNIAETYYPRLTYLLANTRKFGPFISNASATLTTVNGVQYKKWVFSLTTESGVLTVPGPINITIDLYYNNSSSIGYSKIEVIGNVINNVVKTNRYQDNKGLIVVDGDADEIIANYNALFSAMNDNLETKLDKTGFSSYEEDDDDEYGIKADGGNRNIVVYDNGQIYFGDLDSAVHLRDIDGSISVSELIDLDYLFHSYFLGTIYSNPINTLTFEGDTPVGTYFMIYNGISYRMVVSEISATKRVHQFYYCKASTQDANKIVNYYKEQLFVLNDGDWEPITGGKDENDEVYKCDYSVAFTPRIEKANDGKSFYHDVEETSNITRCILLYSSCLYHGFTCEAQFRTGATAKQLNWLVYTGMSTSNVKLVFQGMTYDDFKDYHPSNNVLVDMLFKSEGNILTIYVIETPL